MTILAHEHVENKIVDRAFIADRMLQQVEIRTAFVIQSNNFAVHEGRGGLFADIGIASEKKEGPWTQGNLHFTA